MGNTVKPLVWAPVLGTNERAHSDGLCYEVAQRTSSGEWFWWLQHIPHRLSVPFSTLEAAKAAAQADYEARIRAALIPTPPTVSYDVAAQKQQQAAQTLWDLLHMKNGAL